MPATFESFGIKFLYPDNWTIAERAEDESDAGTTLDLPSGGFLSIEMEDEGLGDDEIIQQVADAIRAEYNEVEIDEIELPGAKEGERLSLIHI